MDKVLALILIQWFSVPFSCGFNVATEGAKIFSGPETEEFGLTVQQLVTNQRKWLLVGSPWSSSPQNRRGDVYKCDVEHPGGCEKLHLDSSIRIDSVQSVNINMSLGLTLIPTSHNHIRSFMTCGPLWAQQCGNQYFYPGVCAEVGPQFSVQSSFSPAIQTCGGPMDVAIVLDGSNSIYPWPDVRKFLMKLLENLDIGPDRTRVSIVQYSEDLKFHYKFSFDQNKDKVLETAAKINQKTGQETNSFAAIDQVRREGFQNQNGGRPGASKVMVVMTDGESADGFKGQEVIDRCNQDGIIRFGIAILKESADIQKFIQEIELISSDPTENYMFNVSSEQALINIAGTLGDRIFNIEGTSQGLDYQLEMSQVGFSAHQSKKKQDVLMLGAVGAYGWMGTVVHWTSASSHILPKYAFEHILEERNHSSLLGYSVSTLSDGSMEFFVAGAPRAVHRGQVVVYTLDSQKKTIIVDSQRGDQIGSYFGSVLCPVDVDADGVTDLLLVGAPMYMSEEKFETGRVYLFSFTKGILSRQGSLDGPSALENARFGTAIIAGQDLNLDGFSDVVVGAPLEANGQGAIYIYYGDKRNIRQQITQKILGSKLDPAMKLFGRSLYGGEDMNRDSIPDVSVGGFGKVLQLWSREVAEITTTTSFSPGKISILSKPCVLGGRPWSCFTAKICFKSKFRPSIQGSVGIKYNLTLDSDLQSSRPTSRAQFGTSDRVLQKALRITAGETCEEHVVYVQETADLINPVALRLDISPQNPNAGPALDAFRPKSWASFVPFIKDCGSDDKCTCDLKLSVKAVDVSSSLLVSPERRQLSFIVTVVNRKEHAYNTRLLANFSRNLFYAFVVPPEDLTEVKCTSISGSLACRVGHPSLTPGQTVTFKINFDFNLNQLEKKAVVNFEVQSDSEEEVTSDNKASASIPVQYDAEIILTRDISLDFCAVGEVDQVQKIISDFKDIGPEFLLSLRVSTGTFPVQQPRLSVSLPTRTKAENPLLYVTSIKTAPIGHVVCSDKGLVDPLKIEEKSHTASFSTENFRGTKELNCDTSICQTLTCVIKDLEIKSSYFVNITMRIWNGTFATADFQTLVVAGISKIETSQPDLLVITHKHQQIQITVSKEGARGDVPVGIIVGSVIGGLLLLAVVTAVLWKLGFFKRKPLPQVKSEQDRAEEEGLCENPS